MDKVLIKYAHKHALRLYCWLVLLIFDTVIIRPRYGITLIINL